MFDPRTYAHEVKLTPKENYFRMLDGRDFEWMPASFNYGKAFWLDEFTTPFIAPGGHAVSALGVEYIGTPDVNYAATPAPVPPPISDIRAWRSQVAFRDISDFDFESYYHGKLKDIDRSRQWVSVSGGDYFLSLVALLGFEEALVALLCEPEDTHDLLAYVHEFYMSIFDMQLAYAKPDFIRTMDDICAEHQPFFGKDTYDEFFKPLMQEVYDKARGRGLRISHHCCGRCEEFWPDWITMGVTNWHPAQVVNDLVGLKERYGDILTFEGAWDSVKAEFVTDEEELRAMVRECIDTFASGGHFTFTGTTGGNPKLDERAKWREDIVLDEYLAYGFDYYR